MLYYLIILIFLLIIIISNQKPVYRALINNKIIYFTHTSCNKLEDNYIEFKSLEYLGEGKIIYINNNFINCEILWNLYFKNNE